MKTAHCRNCGTARPVDEAGCCPAGHELAPFPPAGQDDPAGSEPEPWVLELDDLFAASGDGAPDDGDGGEAPEAHDRDVPDAHAGETPEVHAGDAPEAHDRDVPDAHDRDVPGPDDGDAPGPDDDSLDPDLAVLEAAMAQLDGTASPADDPDPTPAPDAGARNGDRDDEEPRGEDATSGSMSREEMISALQEAPRPRPPSEGDGGDEAPPAEVPQHHPTSDDDPTTPGAERSGEDQETDDEEAEGPSIDPANFTAAGDRIQPGGRSRSTRRLLSFGR